MFFLGFWLFWFFSYY